MYKYNDFDSAFIAERNAQFRAQVARRINGNLTEDEFKPLRLMNGVYLQLHAYMLRVAIPYGTLNSRQMDQLAMIAERWDKGYGHFTTRHDEIDDPRPYAELIRQWSTDHPEFQFLPRKFKIAVTGSEHDRAVSRAHDIGLRMVRRGDQIGFEVIVGGGLGRTPMIGKVLRDFLPIADLLPYLEAVVSVWNILGRRDNKYKARIKITVHENGIDAIRDQVETRFIELRPSYDGADQGLLEQIKSAFAKPAFKSASLDGFDLAYQNDPIFRSWVDTNIAAHATQGYAIASISIKAHGQTPGDATAEQMRVIASLARRFGHDEIRISHEQNVILPHVHKSDLLQVHAELKAAGLATANIGLISDIIACPGMDYCALATARSIPIAQQIATRFDDLKLEHDIGHLQIKISGCINACGHHHVGHIGILGLDRAGVENYQITLGGDATETAALGTRVGPGFSADDILPAIERLIFAYLAIRQDAEETFLQTYRRVGIEPFQSALYDPQDTQAHAAE
ncbi:MAG: nitrite/sulfite reductase [Rhodobacteraceae bacterium]|nr:nitrite/sulfite reductase [Paracoccaceae bacterium]